MATKKKTTSKKKAVRKRATKKSTAKAKATPSNGVEDDAPRIIDGEVYLSPLDLKTYDLAEHRYLVQNQARQLKERERDDAMAKFSTKIAELKRQEQNALRVLMDERARLEAKYSVNFNDPNVSYDDVSGRIMFLPGASLEQGVEN